MKFNVNKDDLYKGIKIVESATSLKALQPVLFNILIETVNKGTIRLVATDMDMTISALINAQVEEEGKITLPAKKLNEIVSKLNDNLISFEMNENENIVNIKCKNSKFDVIGISANEFPRDVYDINLENCECIELELKPFAKAVKQAGFASASIESSNVLSGIVCNIEGNKLEIASTDGNRLARDREVVNNSKNITKQLIIPSKALNEFIKKISMLEENEEKIVLYTEKTKLIIKTEKTMTITSLLVGMYPKYNQLIPQESPKNAIVNVEQLYSAIGRVSIMVNDKTSIVKLNFEDNQLLLSADTPDQGKSEECIAAEYTSEPLTIAFNYKFLLDVLDVLRNMSCENVLIGLNSSLTATTIRPQNDEDFVCIIMPVQLR